MRFGCSGTNWGFLAVMPVDVQMNYGISSVHAQWFTHGKIRADDLDVIK